MNLFDDHMEFISLGGLIMGLSMEAIFMGASQSRNPNLAAVFYRLQLVESYGTGIRKIMRLYSGNAIQPSFRTAEGAFTVSLPNTNLEHTQPASKPTTVTGLDEAKAVVEFVRKKGTASRKDIEAELHVGSTKAYKLLKRLCDEGILQTQGQGNQTAYTLVR